MKRTIFRNIRNEIIEILSQANSDIKIMMAWFTDNEISKVLINLAENIEISIIISDSEWNLLNKFNFKEMLNRNITIRTSGSDTPEKGNFMHRKMCIVDKHIVMSGSYNWTKNASKNIEDFSVIEDENNALVCIKEYNDLWKQSKSINIEKLEKRSKYSFDDLKKLEDEGKEPEFIQHNTNEIIIPKPELPKILNQDITNIISSEQMFIQNVFLQESFLNPYEKIIYNQNLDLWGIEKGVSSLILKFKFGDNIIDVHVNRNDFVKMLKTDKKLFNIWSYNKEKFPISLFNNNEYRTLTLKAPIHFSLSYYYYKKTKNHKRTKKLDIIEIDVFNSNFIFQKFIMHSYGYNKNIEIYL